MDIQVISFGYGHRDEYGQLLLPPRADLTFDLRDRFRDPHADPVLRGLTGLDQVVYDKVLGTPGVPVFVQRVDRLCVDLLDDDGWTTPLTVAFGCVGGRHRSVAIARALAESLENWLIDFEVDLQHRDVDKPILERERGDQPCVATTSSGDPGVGSPGSVGDSGEPPTNEGSA